MKEQTTGKCGAKLWKMDYLKAICIIFVIITHYKLTYVEPIRNSIIYLLLINMAVPVFVIITGYMQSLSCERREVSTIREFYSIPVLINKLKRIVIPYFQNKVLVTLIKLAPRRLTSEVQSIIMELRHGKGQK